MEAGPTIGQPAARLLVGTVRRHGIEPPRRPRYHEQPATRRRACELSASQRPGEGLPGGFLPPASTAPSVTRQRISANQSAGNASSSRGHTFNTFSIPLEATWELDLWGRVRREVEGARASLAASADDLEASKLAIQAEVAIDYFTLRSLDAQNQLLEETVVAYRRSLELTQNRRKGGIATELDVSQAETQLATTQAEIPAVQLQRANFLHALAVLCGQPAPAFEVSVSQGRAGGCQDAPSMPARGIPVAVPSELLERRPGHRRRRTPHGRRQRRCRPGLRRVLSAHHA